MTLALQPSVQQSVSQAAPTAGPSVPATVEVQTSTPFQSAMQKAVDATSAAVATADGANTLTSASSGIVPPRVAQSTAATGAAALTKAGSIFNAGSSELKKRIPNEQKLTDTSAGSLPSAHADAAAATVTDGPRVPSLLAADPSPAGTPAAAQENLPIAIRESEGSAGPQIASLSLAVLVKPVTAGQGTPDERFSKPDSHYTAAVVPRGSATLAPQAVSAPASIYAVSTVEAAPGPPALNAHSVTTSLPVPILTTQGGFGVDPGRPTQPIPQSPSDDVAQQENVALQIVNSSLPNASASAAQSGVPGARSAGSAVTGTRATSLSNGPSFSSPGLLADPTGVSSVPTTFAHSTAPVGSSASLPATAPGWSATHTFERLDTAIAANATPLRTDARSLEVGVQSGSLGWVEVHATTDAQGQISASLHAQSESAAQSLAGHIDHIAAYAQQHAVHVDQVSVGVGSGDSGGGRQAGADGKADQDAESRPDRVAEPASFRGPIESDPSPSVRAEDPYIRGSLRISVRA